MRIVRERQKYFWHKICGGQNRRKPLRSKDLRRLGGSLPNQLKIVFGFRHFGDILGLSGVNDATGFAVDDSGPLVAFGVGSVQLYTDGIGGNGFGS